MAVRIPRVKPIPSSPAPTTGRIRATIQDDAAGILRGASRVASLVDTGEKIRLKYEDEKINQLSNETKQAYNEWNTTALLDLRKIKGDPTDAYVEYEEAEQKKYQELLDKRPDLNERVKRHVTANLQKVQSSYRMKVLKQRGMQQETYKNNLFESTVKLEKSTLPDNASLASANIKGSFLPFDQNLSDLATTISQRGLEDRTVTQLPDDAKSWSHAYRDGDGKLVKVKWDESAQLRVATEQGEGVTATINSIIDSGETEQAELIYDRYKDYLDPKSKSKLLNKFEKETKRDEAFDLAGEIETKPKADQVAAIDNIKDPEVKSETLKIMSTNASRRANLTKRSQDVNYEVLLKNIDAMRKAGQINGVSDLESSQAYKATWDKLSRKQQKSIEEEFKAPKKSNNEALVTIQDLILGDLSAVTPAQFQESLVGLKESDKGKYTTRYLNAKSQKSNLISTTRVNKRGSELLKNKLYATGLIKNNEYGKLDKKSFDSLAKANDDLINYLEGVPATISDKDLSDHVNNYIDEKKKTELFGGGPSFFSRFNPFSDDEEEVRPTPRAIPRPAKDDADLLKGLDARAIFNLQKQYKRKFNRKTPDPTDPAFLNYVRSLK